MNNSTITIELTRGYSTVIDEIDGDLARYNWSASSRLPPYAHGWWAFPEVKRVVPLHRVIIARMINRIPHRTEEVDHINGDRLDNRRANLRLASHAQNQQNRGKLVTNKSGFKGVHWHRRAQKWRAMIRVDGKSHHLGYFDSPEDAHIAYCKAAEIAFGEYARTESFLTRIYYR